MKAKKILFITQEIEPYVPSSEFTLLGRQMSQYIQEKDARFALSCPNGVTLTNDATNYTR